MARKYAKVYLSIWATDFRELSVAAQHLYLLLLSNPKLSAAGCIVAQPRKWSRYSEGCSKDSTEGALEELSKRRYVLCDEDTDEVLIRSFIRHDDGVGNKFLRKAIESAIAAIESPALKAHATLELAAAVKYRENPSLADQLEDLRGPLRGPSEDPYEGLRRLTTTINLQLHLQPQPNVIIQHGVTWFRGQAVAAPSDDDDQWRANVINAIIAARMVKPPTKRQTYMAAARANFAKDEATEFAAWLKSTSRARSYSPEMAARSFLSWQNTTRRNASERRDR